MLKTTKEGSGILTIYLSREKFNSTGRTMAFKQAKQTQSVPDSPERLLLELPRRKIPGLLMHQGEMLKAYHQEALDKADVALQLPTGSGKTLVGLMLAEWRRRKFNERVLYLCPTKQLVNQVVQQAKDIYGLDVNGFTGPASQYNPVAKAQYQDGDRVAVTTYNSLFNTHPYFSNADIIIIDDAHAAENHITSLWSLRIGRDSHITLHAAIANLLKPHLQPHEWARFNGRIETPGDSRWVDKIPFPLLSEIKDDLCAIIDANSDSHDLKYSWSMLKDHMHAVNVYISSQGVLIRPLIPPTWSHSAYNDAKQRIFMSATLGAGGDLERLTGRKSIHRLPVPDGWDKQGIGRRFFVFPSLSLNDDQVDELRRKMMSEAGRSLVLVPSERQQELILQDVKAHLDHVTLRAGELEYSKEPFTQQPNAVAVIANRYDGIDFPGDDCRLLFVDGLPRATNAQERFLMERMGAGLLFNDRVQTRVLQAIGRCTRSLQDYSAVVVTGAELPDYLVDRSRRTMFHPELQAELEFGIEQSKETSAEDMLENFKLFLANDKDWEAANAQIIDYRGSAIQTPFPAMGDLESVVKSEIEYQKSIWQGDFETAMAKAEEVLGGLENSELRGYRALWCYLAGSAAWGLSLEGQERFRAKALEHYNSAKRAATNVPWLVALSRYQGDLSQSDVQDIATQKQVESLEAFLISLGTSHTRQFEAKEKKVIDGLNEPSKFEEAHKCLGEILGFEAGKEETDASPDPWWILGDTCIVFEDHAGASPESSLDATKARQTSSHPDWIRANLSVTSECEIIPVLVSPVTTAHQGAVPHLNNFSYWNLSEFKDWAINAIAVVRELRAGLVEPGDLAWRAQAAEALIRHKLDITSLTREIKQKTASAHLKQA